VQVEVNDCEPILVVIDGGVSNLGCEEVTDPSLVLGHQIREDGSILEVRVFCEPFEDGVRWRVQYRSAASGGGSEYPISDTWADAEDVEFICPDCADAVDGIATGSIEFIAHQVCDTSGGDVFYDILVTATIELPCE
jgi:hypothetical protein